MRKNLKAFVSIIILFIVITVFVCNTVSCSEKNSNTLQVKSISYPTLTTLTAAEPDIVMIFKHMSTSEFSDYFCYVSEDNGELVITNKDENPKSHLLDMNCGFFFGINGWHSGGCYFTDEYGNQEKITSDNCYGIIRNTNDLGYMITGKPGGDSSVYKLNRISDSDWEYEVITEFDGTARCYYYDQPKNMIYISSTEGLISVDLTSGSLTTLYAAECWRTLPPNSVAKVNNCLYWGAYCGIYEYDLETNDITWFPIDYEKYVTLTNK